MDEIIGNSNIVTITSTNNIDPKNFIPGSGGATFRSKQPEITIRFIKDKERPVSRIDFPNSDNVKEVKITLVPADGKKQPQEFDKVDASKPFLTPITEDIKQIRIKVISTNNNKNVENLEISVKSCSQETTIVSTTRTTTGTGSTTTTPTTTTTTGTGSTTTTPTTTTTTGTGSTTTSPTTTIPQTTTTTGKGKKRFKLFFFLSIFTQIFIKLFKGVLIQWKKWSVIQNI